MDQPDLGSASASDERAVDEALKALTQIFSSQELSTKIHLRCGIDGPNGFDIFFASMCDDLFGRDPNADYKSWIRLLYRLGLISAMPSE
jgi:hypothetical protein